MSLPLATAERIATKIAETIHPSCEQIEIDGSIRRHTPTIPTPGGKPRGHHLEATGFQCAAPVVPLTIENVCSLFIRKMQKLGRYETSILRVADATGNPTPKISLMGNVTFSPALNLSMTCRFALMVS